MLTGCAMEAPYRGEQMYWGRGGYNDGFFWSLYGSNLENGKTTEAQVRHWFGPPWLVTKDQQGRTQYLYLFGGFGPRVDLSFDEQGVLVTHFVLRGEGGETGTPTR
jgi:hypothetical protein